MPFNQKAKIVATLGPASSDRDSIRELLLAGVDVFRLNFSHGSTGEKAAILEIISQVTSEEKINAAILMDLQGPKLRVGELPNGQLSLIDEEIIYLSPPGIPGDENTIIIQYENLLHDIKPGSSVLLDDGKIILSVQGIDNNRLKCRIIAGGVLLSRKGVNFPGSSLNIPSLTDKDKVNIKFAANMNADYIAMSFVRSAQDIRELRGLIAMEGVDIPIIAKIEKTEALDELDEIIEASDGVMIARGDLGVEIEPQKVPLVQKEIIRKASRKGKLVITATQMLESMMYNPLPTRAEATDVANAVLDGTDAVMLSGETASGKFPAKAVKMMANIIEETEVSELSKYIRSHLSPDQLNSIVDGICRACVAAAEQVFAKAIIVFTQSGFTAHTISKYRPGVPIIAFTPHPAVHRRLSLVWGVSAYLTDKKLSLDEVVDEASQKVKELGIGHVDDIVAILCGIPLRSAANTNLLKLHKL